jgi:hypothetical protein
LYGDSTKESVKKLSSAPQVVAIIVPRMVAARMAVVMLDEASPNTTVTPPSSSDDVYHFSFNWLKRVLASGTKSIAKLAQP